MIRNWNCHSHHQRRSHIRPHIEHLHLLHIRKYTPDHHKFGPIPDELESRILNKLKN